MTTPAHSERAHARLSPSSAERWTTCTAYPAAVEANRSRLPKDNGSTASREGTLAHEVLEAIMRGKEAPSGALPEMIVHAKACQEFIKSLTVGVVGSSSLSIELEVPLWYAPEENGHVDYFLSINHSNGAREFHVIDYKYGYQPVDAENNKQMSIYGISAIRARHDSAPDDSKVTLHIFQPRSRKGDDEGPDSSWPTTWGRLQLFAAAEIDPKVEVIENDECAHLRKFVPSDKACQFCELRKANLCAAYTDKMLAVEGFDGITELQAGELEVVLPTVEDLTEPGKTLEEVLCDAADAGGDVNYKEAVRVVEGYLSTRSNVRARPSDMVLVNIYRAAPRIRKWLDGIEEHLETMANDGRPVAGTKLVEGKGSRAFRDEERAAKLLRNYLPRERIYEEKLISPAKAEKELKGVETSSKFKNALAALIERKAGTPVLALADDKRKAVRGANEEFEEDFSSLLD